MKKIITFQVLGLLIMTSIFLWYQDKKHVVTKEVKTASVEKKMSVVATFYPLEEFARAVGGDRVTVTSIVPGGVEPHEYEPTQRDILSAYQADVFLLNGAGVDAWAEKIRPELEARGVKVVQMSELLPLLSDTDGVDRDPHFWLDPLLATKEVLAIKEALILRDEAGKAVYAQNAGAYVKQLQNIDASYRTGLAVCQLRTIVTTHAAFGYLANRYNFDMIALSGLSPEVEPTSRTLAAVVTIVRDKGIRYIFFETLVSPKIAETLAREVGVDTLSFNPLEGLTDEERARGESYMTIMGENLSNLQTALQCQK